ncbi:MAG: FliG C-terminal domain-containing protein [Roseicyclus sp.]
MDLMPALSMAEPMGHRDDAAPRQLTRRQKAAIVVRLLLSHGVSPGVNRLPPNYQSILARSMQGLGQIERDTLREIVTEFTDQLDRLGLIMPRGMHETLEILDPYISDMARDGLASEADIGDGTDPWLHLAAMEPHRLRPVLDVESAEVCAILLSKLSVSKAAKLLADLPPERAELIAHAVALTHTVSIETILRIGEHLHAQIVAEPRAAFDATAVERMGALLNEAGREAREAVLAGLETRDPDFARAVRRSIFTFEHIPKRVSATDVPRITTAVDGETLITALAAGLEQAPATVEFLLDNMSKRMADQFREEAQARGTPPAEEAEAAMAAVITEIRNLEEQGTLRLMKLTDD